jgi:hypothetical protein
MKRIDYYSYYYYACDKKKKKKQRSPLHISSIHPNQPKAPPPPPMKVKEALEALGLSATATAEERASAFRRRILQWHPDKAPKTAEAEEEAKRQTQRLLEARARLVAAGLGFHSPSAAIPSKKKEEEKDGAQGARTTHNSTNKQKREEEQWRERCAQRRAHTAETRERLWQTHRAAAQEARAEEWRARVRPSPNHH